MDRPAAKAPDGAPSDESLFETLIATAVDGIMVINERGIVRVYNKTCERLFILILHLTRWADCANTQDR